VWYFAEFLGPELQSIDLISAQDMRRFISALRGKPKYSSYPFNKPQKAKLSVQSIET